MKDAPVTITITRSDAYQLCGSLSDECPYCNGPTAPDGANDWRYEHSPTCAYDRIVAAALKALER